MKFYTRQHRHYCGIDLHARSMYACILDQAGEVVVHKNIRAEPAAFLELVEPYRRDDIYGLPILFRSLIVFMSWLLFAKKMAY